MTNKYRAQLKDKIRKQLEDKNKLLIETAQKYAYEFLIKATINTEFQRNIVLDTHLQIAIFGDRRASKTTTAGINAIFQCLLIPGSKVLYIGLTQEAAKRSFYDEALAGLISDYKLPCHLLGDNECVFDNG